jgi:hypothetical protein
MLNKPNKITIEYENYTVTIGKKRYVVKSQYTERVASGYINTHEPYETIIEQTLKQTADFRFLIDKLVRLTNVNDKN